MNEHTEKLIDGIHDRVNELNLCQVADMDWGEFGYELLAHFADFDLAGHSAEMLLGCQRYLAEHPPELRMSRSDWEAVSKANERNAAEAAGE